MGHDIVEIVSSHETILIEISFRKNVVQLFLAQVLSQVLSYFLELKHSDLALNYIISTDRFTSKEFQTLSISALLSLSPILAVANLKN